MKIKLSDKDISKLKEIPETKMGYHIVSIETINGTIYKNVLIEGCTYISGIYGCDKIPFNAKEIKNIKVTDLQKPDDFDSSKWLIL
ncbi:MAG: hypothetical protein P9M03_10295 [Candidatus Theseobacter exili]|nr:hypothetical protein [Candidatus Theseobacter exili]